MMAALALPIALGRYPKYRDGLLLYWGFVGLVAAWFAAALMFERIMKR